MEHDKATQMQDSNAKNLCIKMLRGQLEKTIKTVPQSLWLQMLHSQEYADLANLKGWQHDSVTGQVEQKTWKQGQLVFNVSGQPVAFSKQKTLNQEGRQH